MKNEFSWHKELFNGKYNLVPGVRDQGEGNTCVFQALSATGEMESKRFAALRNKTCTRKFLTETFIQDYEKSKGKIPNDTTSKSRLAAALELFMTDGVLAETEGKTERVKLRAYHSRSGLSFPEIAAIIGEGRPIVGGFRIDASFANLEPGAIYKYDKNEGKKTDTGLHCSHAVVFIGFGWVEPENEPYLVFLNSHGEKWCEGGIGRVYFEDVRGLFTIDLDL